METGGDKRQKEGTEREVGGRESRRRREWRQWEIKGNGEEGGGGSAHTVMCVGVCGVCVRGGGGEERLCSLAAGYRNFIQER